MLPFIQPKKVAGCLATPNCVGFMDCTSPVVGEAATEQASNNLANTIFAPQRLLGVTWRLKKNGAGFQRLQKLDDIFF